MLLREFTLLGEVEGHVSRYTVEWEPPTLSDGHSVTRVWATSDDPQLTFLHEIGGADPAQSVALALRIVEKSLLASRASGEARLYWLEPDMGLGF
jgi:hypothetical protein